MHIIFFCSNNIFEVGIGLKTVHIAVDNLVAEGIVNLSTKSKESGDSTGIKVLESRNEFKFVVIKKNSYIIHTSSGIRSALWMRADLAAWKKSTTPSVFSRSNCE